MCLAVNHDSDRPIRCHNRGGRTDDQRTHSVLDRLFAKRSLCALLVALLVGLLLASAPNHVRADDTGDLRQTRELVVEMAQTQDKNQFIGKYMLLLAQHHVRPILDLGSETKVGGGASFRIAEQGIVCLRDCGGQTFVPKTPTFVRAVGTDGIWTTVDDTRADEFLCLVIKTRKVLFVLDPRKATIGIVDIPVAQD